MGSQRPAMTIAKQWNNAHKCPQCGPVLKLADKDNQIPRATEVGTEQAFCALSDWL